MTALQVHEIVQQISATHGLKDLAHIADLVRQIEDAGWKLGIDYYSHVLYLGRLGRPLRTPKREWRNIAHWHNTETMERVFYWDNVALTKREALSMSDRTPPPPGGFHTFNVNNTNA
jgi:hypothetical protein